MMSENKELKGQIDALEKKYDEQFQVVFTAIKQLLDKKNEPRVAIGFKLQK